MTVTVHHGDMREVLRQMKADGVLIELNPDYAAMARRRIKGESPLLSSVA